jgi:hypothetical protein
MSIRVKKKKPDRHEATIQDIASNTQIEERRHLLEKLEPWDRVSSTGWQPHANERI